VDSPPSVVTSKQNMFQYFSSVVATAHQPAEEVEISVCHLDENGEQRTLFQTQFTYTVDSTQHMAELLIQSVSERGIPLQYFLFPSLPTEDAWREFDHSLTEEFKSTRLPEGWTLVGFMTQEECACLAGEEKRLVSDWFEADSSLHFSKSSQQILVKHCW